MDSSLCGYLECVRKEPVLTGREERSLARRWRESGDEEARNLLVRSQLRFVLIVARGYRRPGVSLSDLVAEGNLGLLHAANKSIQAFEAIQLFRAPHSGSVEGTAQHRQRFVIGFERYGKRVTILTAQGK